MKKTVLRFRALCHCAVAGGLFLVLPTSQGAQRIAGAELDGVEVRLEPKSSAPATRGGPGASAPLTWAPPGAKPVRYDSLELKGLSGSAGARFALINNQSFRTNESALVTLGNKRVRVECLAIREKSVLVKVEGDAQPRELKLLSQAPIPALAPPRTTTTSRLGP